MDFDSIPKLLQYIHLIYNNDIQNQQKRNLLIYLFNFFLFIFSVNKKYKTIKFLKATKNYTYKIVLI